MGKPRKVRTTVFLDRRLVETAKGLGVNISEAAERGIQAAIYEKLAEMIRSGRFDGRRIINLLVEPVAH